MNNQALDIHHARTSELSAVKALADKNKATLGFISRGVIATAQREERLLVAGVGEEVVGFTEYYCRRDGQLTIYAIVVGEGWRRRGVGSAMLSYLKHELAHRAMTQIALKCPRDLPSNEFYAALGFQWACTELKPQRRALNVWVYKEHRP